MDFTGRGAAAFAGAMTLANNSRAVRMDGDADPGKVDGQEVERIANPLRLQ